MTLTEWIRKAVRESGGSQADVARFTGIGPATLSRFLSGQGGLSLKSLDALVSALRVVVVTLDEWEKRERIWAAYKRGDLLRCVPTVAASPKEGEKG